MFARFTLAQWVGECGAQLQPLVDALTNELHGRQALRVLAVPRPHELAGVEPPGREPRADG